MNINCNTRATPEHSHVSTEEFAARMMVLSATVLKTHSRTGQYAGVRPVRLPNRRLAWPVDEIEKLFLASRNRSATEA
ncbi:DNA-binding protein [Burkholderia gladioli]|uniref:DNA-binding protein n=1 Tax=Burkholderia gladioli TaxID=28095 RepID=UPI000F5426ED|nr:DNA-binding protein [Burkholderia gladioli]